jgi:hypothetical protein
VECQLRDLICPAADSVRELARFGGEPMTASKSLFTPKGRFFGFITNNGHIYEKGGPHFGFVSNNE